MSEFDFPPTEDGSRALVSAITRILFEEDPVGIGVAELFADGWDAADEYRLEAEAIAARLCAAACVDDVARLAHVEFCRWFGPATAASVSRYHGTAARIWPLLQSRAG